MSPPKALTSRKEPKAAFVMTADDWQYINRIPLKYGNVLEALRVNKSYVKTAESMQLPIGTVKSRSNRAREAIQKLRDQTAAQAVS